MLWNVTAREGKRHVLPRYGANPGENWILSNHVRHKLYIQSDVLLLPSERRAPARAVVSQPVPGGLGRRSLEKGFLRAHCGGHLHERRSSCVDPLRKKSSKMFTLSSWVGLRPAGTEVVSCVMEAALYKPAGDERRECYKYPGSLHPHPCTHNFPVKAGRYLWNVLTQRPAVSLLVKW